MDKVECVVLGAGVVGLAVASRLAMAGIEVLVLEQHNAIGTQISSRNSEVIHAGIYYPVGSTKAQLCVRGKALLYEHCDAFGVPYRRCGKLIVASHADQLDVVRGYLRKGARNQVHDLTWLSAAQIKVIEPEVRGVGALWSPSTGIIDSHAYMVSLQGQLEAAGGCLSLRTKVEHVSGYDPTIIHTEALSLQARWLINCAGLSASQFAADTAGCPRPYYAKGHYYAYSGQSPFRHLVYPLAEPGGLGIHATLDLAGQLKFGPDVCWIDQVDYGFDESVFNDFVAAVMAYYPRLDPARLHPSYTGIRPKIAPREAGFQDFRIDGPAQHGVKGRLNLLGNESPGLTASLAIAEEVVSLVKA